MIGGIKRDKYDDIFSLYIRAKENFTCVLTGKRYRPPKELEKLNKKLFDKLNNPSFTSSQGLHCSHYFGRVNKSVRYDEDNADSFSMMKHQEYEEEKGECKDCNAPRKYKKFMIEKLGEEGFDNLTRKKNQIKQYKKGKIKGKKWDQRDEVVLEYYKEKIRSL